MIESLLTMRHVRELRQSCLAGRSIGQIERDMSRPVLKIGYTARDGGHLPLVFRQPREMLDSGAADDAGGAHDEHVLLGGRAFYDSEQLLGRLQMLAEH